VPSPSVLEVISSSTMKICIFRCIRKIAKSSFILSVHLSVCMERLSSHCTDFYEICYLSQTLYCPTNAHKVKNVELLKQSKIKEAASTCFGLQGNHHQAATAST